MNDNSSFLDIVNLHKSFHVSKSFFSKSGLRLKAVNDVSLCVKQGETFGLVGESGCGKSTLARLILCLDKPDKGEICFKGKNIFSLKGPEKKDFRRRVQIVFQDPFSSLNPRKKAGSIIGEPLIIHKIASGKEVRGRVMELMDLAGLQKDHIDRYPHEFSSGQRQRIGLARALSLSPELIVADEPVSALDVSIQAQTINLLMDIQKKMNLSYLFISHDLAVVRYVSTKVAVMYLGKIIESAPSDDLYNCPMHPYTEALLSAVPVPDPFATKKRIILNGEMSGSFSHSKGCVFFNRCPIADKTICIEKQPPLEEKQTGHWLACWLR